MGGGTRHSVNSIAHHSYTVNKTRHFAQVSVYLQALSTGHVHELSVASQRCPCTIPPSKGTQKFKPQAKALQIHISVQKVKFLEK